MSEETDRPGLDEARAGFIRQSLASLSPAERRALDLVAVSHWIPASAVMLKLRDDLLVPLPDLLDRSLVGITDGGALTVHPTLRTVILAGLDREEITKISSRLMSIFEADDSPEARIESLYLRLAFEPREAAKEMFRTALTLRSEPFFAHQLVRRLVQVWREFQQRWTLDPVGTSYLRLTDLIARPRPPGDELAALRRLGQPPGDGVFAAYVDLRSGLALAALTRVEEADHALRSARLQFDMLGMPAEAARALRGLGRLLTKIDRYQEAAAAYGEALDLSRTLDLPVASAQSLQGLAEIDAFSGRLEPSIERFEEAIAIQSAHNGRTAEANTRVSFSQLLTVRGDLAGARQHLQLAADAFDSVGQKLGKANSLKGMAVISLEEGKLADAEINLRAAREMFEALRTPTGLAGCTEIEGHILMLRGDLEGATRAFEEALSAYQEYGDRYSAAACFRDLGAVAWLGGRRRDAGRYLERSARDFRSLEARLDAILSATLARLAIGESPPRGYAQELAAAAMDIPRSFRPIWDSAGHSVQAG